MLFPSVVAVRLGVVAALLNGGDVRTGVVVTTWEVDEFTVVLSGEGVVVTSVDTARHNSRPAVQDKRCLLLVKLYLRHA